MREPFDKFVKANLKPDVLMITCGLPASWKTETSEEIAEIKGYTIVRTDLIRKEVLKGEDIFDEKVASNMDKRMLVYDETFRQAEELLKKGKGIIIDATFITQSLRRRAAALAAKYKRTFVILHTQCPREKKFEKVDLDDLKKLNPNLDIVHLIVDTTKDQPEGWYIIGAEKR
jgi:predicted kinase